MGTYEETSAAKSKTVTLSFLRSVLPDDHMTRTMLRKCKRLEIAINDCKKNYIDKVEVLMSVLESLLADWLIRVSPETTSLLFDYLLNHTLLLVFHGDWGENKAIVFHMLTLFKQFKVRAEKKKLVRVVGKIEYLLQLIGKDPWGNVALVKIFGDGGETKDELLEFVKIELEVFLNFRLEVLIYSRCDMQAMTLTEKCLQCVSNPVNSECFQSFTDEITRLRDLYLLILNKAKSNEYIRGKILNEVKKMGLKECLMFVNRCRSGQLPFEILSKKSADVVVSMALASAVIKESADESILQEAIQLWFDSFTDNQVLFRLLNHMLLNAVCSRYIYSFGKKLIEKFEHTQKELCVEIFIRGMTLNVNEIERYKTCEDDAKVGELKVQLSKGFLQLAEYLKGDVLLHRECVLAAFSLDPSQRVFERIKVLGEITGNLSIETKTKGSGDDPPLNKETDCLQEERSLSEGDRNQTAMTGHELELPPVSAQPVNNQTDFKELKEGSSTFEKDPLLVQQETPVHDTVYLKETLKDHPEQTQGKERILEENQLNEGKSSEEITHYKLSQQVLNLTIKDDVHVASDHDKETNLEDASEFCFKSGSLHFLQAYDAENIGIPQTLCDDLATLVYSVKSPDLTWDLEWAELVRRCETYIEQGKSNKRADKVDCNTSQVKSSEELCDEVSGNTDHIRAETPTKSSKRKRKHKW